jgi:hypothetical protein
MESSKQTPVYNRYLRGDFQVGQDNLNPLREIETDILQDLEALRLQMYLKYKDKIGNLKGDNNLDTPEDLGLPYEDRTQITTNVSLTDGLPATLEPITIEDDLNNILKMLNAFLGGEPISFDELPFDICGDRSSRSVTTGSGDSDTGNAGTTNGSLVGAGYTSSSGASTGSAAANSDLSCIMVELQYLQAILALLGIVKKIIALEQQLLAIVYPVLEVVTLIVSSILNPAARTQLIMMLVGQAMAVIISFLTDMLSTLLGNLNLDCLLSSSMAAVQSIVGTVTSVRDAGSEARSFISFNKKLASGVLSLSTEEGLAAALGLTVDQLHPDPAEMFSSSVDAVLKGVKQKTTSTAKTLAGPAVVVAGGVAQSIDTTIKLVKDFFPNGKFAVY